MGGRPKAGRPRRGHRTCGALSARWGLNAGSESATFRESPLNNGLGRPVSRILLYPAIHLREIPGLPLREAAPTSPGRFANRPYRQFGLLAPVVYLAGPSGFRLGMPPVGSYPTLSPITCDRQRSYPIHRLVCSLLHLTWRRACAHPSLGLLGRAASATSPDFALRFGPKPWNAATGRTARTGWIIP